MNTYRHDSESKQIVRGQWVQYIKDIKEGDSSPLKLITLPSSEIQELFLYKEAGLIDAEYDENSGQFDIKEGDIYCFEKKASRYRELFEKLIGATTRQDDIGSYIRTHRPKILNNKSNLGFPLDAVNLDFEGSLCKLKIPIEETVENIIACQSASNKPFAFFLTFPNTEDTDTDEYKQSIRTELEKNLNDAYNIQFQDNFKHIHADIDSMEYETLHTVAVFKSIIKQISQKNYTCDKSKIIIYGDKERTPNFRKRMTSFLFKFVPDNSISHTEIYYRDILQALTSPDFLLDG